MARLTERPYSVTWEPNLRKIIRHTPDAIVFLNGDLSVPGCASCGGRVDIQKYITAVSCDPSTSPMASASISLSIPKADSHGLFRDGQFVLEPGLEIHIYMRGYFPAAGLLAGDENALVADPTGAVTDTPMYPYYLTFHGVVVNTSYAYSSGAYTASLSCTDLLHFWQYQRLVEQGSVLAPNFAGSKVTSSLVGHNFAGMSPYSIIYTLFRDTMGAAGGVETVLIPGSDVSNASSVSSVDGQPLFKHAERYWKKRFSQTIANLRMFGASGKVYSATQAAFLARLETEQLKYLTSRADNPILHTQENDPMSPLLRQARAVGFDPFTLFATGAGGVSGTVNNDKDGTLGINSSVFQAYVSDISKWGQFNLFETSYLTKMEIANAVAEVTGFEFFQDVDGDIVFKPPFYNLDTSGLRVYRIEPEDVISFDTQDKEPECTVVKITGGQFSNLGGIDLTGEFGIRAEFVDFRAVAKYGWRQEVFDSSYFNDARSAFYAAIARYDIYNIAVKSASVTIPLRPEMRPGYPVYIAHVDCFYYVTALSHSFSFGGQCNTSLTLVGRRAKFHAPGKPTNQGLPTIKDIDLSNMHLPALPLTLAGVVSGATSGVGYATGDPENPYLSDPYAGANVERRTQGFPNVVMSLDATLTPPLTQDYTALLDSMTTVDGVRGLIRTILGSRNNPLLRSPNAPASNGDKGAAYDGPFQIQLDNGVWKDLPSYEQIAAVARQARKDGSIWRPAATVEAAASAAQYEVEQAYGALMAAAQSVYAQGLPGAGTTAYMLERVSDFKSMFSPGKAVPKGYYRYFSSAHPDADQQGMRSVNLAGAPGELFRVPGTVRATQFSPDGQGFVLGRVEGGIPIAQSGGAVTVRPTHLITSFDLARISVDVEVPFIEAPVETKATFLEDDLSQAISNKFLRQMENVGGDADLIAVCSELFTAEKNRLLAALARLPSPMSPAVGKGLFGLDVLTNAAGAAEYVTSQWNPQRYHPTRQRIQAHNGTDLRAPIGTPVKAANQGVVTLVRAPKPSSSAGLYLEIDHGRFDAPTGTFVPNGWRTVYMHMSQIGVKKGDFVSFGQQIGLSGNTGDINTGPHLHFELRLNGKSVNAQLYRLSGNGFEPATTTGGSTIALDSLQNATMPPFGQVASLTSFMTPRSQTIAYGLNAQTPPPTTTTVASVDVYQKLCLANGMAQALAQPCAQILTTSSNQNPALNRQYADFWTLLYPTGTNPKQSVVSSVTQKPNKRTMSIEVPVFPVSDDRGYEVVGTYAYGRGLNLMTDQQTQLQRVGTPTNYTAVEDFVNAVRLNGSTNTAAVAEAIGRMDPDTRADLAASTQDPNLQRLLEVPSVGKAGRGANSPASSSQGVGVFSPLNAAYGLADMKVGAMDMCTCFLNQPDVLFLRGIGEANSVVLEGTPDDFVDSIQDIVLESVPGWAATQDAYRGGSLGSYDNQSTASKIQQSADQIAAIVRGNS